VVILPLLGVIEKPLAQPATIEEAVKAKYAKQNGGTNSTVKPAE
jgi:ubiquinol-cytochrome c reductase cytochrome b subunit